MNQIAHELHARLGFRTPVPVEHAAAEGVGVRRILRPQTGPLISSELIYYEPTACQRETGYRIALALSRAALARRGAVATRTQVEETAVELLLPSWFCSQNAGRVAAVQLWAPLDMCRERDPLAPASSR